MDGIADRRPARLGIVLLTYVLLLPARATTPASVRQSPVSATGSEIAVAISALQTDVLRKGSRAEGFLFFERFEGVGPLTLTFELRAQEGNTLFGLIAVPLTRSAGSE